MRIPFIVMAALVAAGAAPETALIQPAELASQLAAKGAHPVIFFVGPNLIYRAKHIPGAVDIGPASRSEGLALLKEATQKLPRDREIVVYCGCCPWQHCPNIRPAIEALKQMGFKRVKAMYIGTDFLADWTSKGYPVEAGH